MTEGVVIAIICPACEEAVLVDEVELRAPADFHCPACTVTVGWAPDPEPVRIDLEAAA